MKTIRRYFLLLPVLIGLAVIATSCDDNDSPEDPILRPLEQHIQGVWQEWMASILKRQTLKATCWSMTCGPAVK